MQRYIPEENRYMRMMHIMNLMEKNQKKRMDISILKEKKFMKRKGMLQWMHTSMRLRER